jgi:hypothetical protein
MIITLLILASLSYVGSTQRIMKVFMDFRTQRNYITAKVEYGATNVEVPFLINAEFDVDYQHIYPVGMFINFT